MACARLVLRAINSVLFSWGASVTGAWIGAGREKGSIIRHASQQLVFLPRSRVVWKPQHLWGTLQTMGVRGAPTRKAVPSLLRFTMTALSSDSAV